MSELFDDLSRILGSKMPRREAIRLVLVGVAGTYLGLLWPRSARAADPEIVCGLLTNPVLCPQNRRTDCDDKLHCCADTPGGGKQDCCMGVDANNKPICRCCKKGCCNPATGQCMGAGIRVTGYHAAPPGRVDFEVESYGGTGLASVTVAESLNVVVDIPSFAAGTPSVEVTATRIDPTLPANVKLFACPVAGCPTCGHVGDPALTELRIREGETRARDSFSGIPAAEHFVTVQNGAPGVPRIHVYVNDRQIETLTLTRSEVRTIDIGRAMTKPSNTVTVVAAGRPGHRALVVVSDETGIPGPGKLAAGRPFLVWESDPAAEGPSLHWGR
jgi:hypothetical protein